MKSAGLSAFGMFCPPSAKTSGWCVIGELASGAQVSMPVRLLAGAQSGPLVGMSAMLHGDEYNGFAVVNRLFDELDPLDVTGALIGLPVANPFALLTGTRASQLEYERLNLNRVFPGNERGFQMERLAHLIYQDGVLASDVWMDFHEGGRDFIARYLIVGTDQDDREKIDRDLQLARWFGQGIPITAVSVTEEQRRLARTGAITVQARAAGKSALGIELGGGGTLRDDFVEAGVVGARRVLRGLGVLAGGAPPDDGSQYVCRESEWPRPQHGGFFEQVVDLGDTVERGEPVGFVRNLLGEVVEEIRAPFRSVITDIRHTATIQTGEWCVKCGRIGDV